MATAKKPAPVRKTTPKPPAGANRANPSVKAKAALPAAPVPSRAVKAATPVKDVMNAKVPVRVKSPKVIKPTKEAKVVKDAKVEKPKKAKLVRDSFTIPKPEYVVLDSLKQRAAKLSAPTKKSELLRAGIKALAAMSDDAFKAALAAVPAIKTGRPKAD